MTRDQSPLILCLSGSSLVRQDCPVAQHDSIWSHENSLFVTFMMFWFSDCDDDRNQYSGDLTWQETQTVIHHWVALVPSIKYDTRSHHQVVEKHIYLGLFWLAGSLVMWALIGKEGDIVFLPQRRVKQNKQARNIHCITDIEATTMITQKVVNTKYSWEYLWCAALCKLKVQLLFKQDWVCVCEAIWIFLLGLFARATLGWWMLKPGWNLFKWT